MNSGIVLHPGVHAVVERRLRALALAGVRLDAGARVLDLGCGNGDTVASLLHRGYDARGCDLGFRPGPNLDLLLGQELLSKIQMAPYHLPYEDGSFDLVVSDQVMEHVQDYASTIAETARVTKPGGVGLHVFPARWRVIEAHLDVPFAGAIQSRAWLSLWARLGIRNPHQVGKGAAETVEINVRYLAERTNYLTRGAIRAAFAAHFAQVDFVERPFLMVSKKTQRFAQPPVLGPLFAALYHTFGMRVLLVRRRI